jgi:hypothetical protein
MMPGLNASPFGWMQQGDDFDLFLTWQIAQIGK